MIDRPAMVVNTPDRIAYRPVRITARLGEQYGGA
jgi:hypothetical protein